MILARPALVLLGDTCGLLDPARSPLRPKSGGLLPVLELLKAAERQPPDLWIVIPAKVTEEWQTHFDATVNELQRHIKQLREDLVAIKRASEAVGLLPPAELVSDADRLPAILAQLSQRLFDAAYVLVPDEECRQRAGVRVSLCEPPARQGKSPNDSIIFEHCLALSKTLQGDGFALPCVFASSNTNDYYAGRVLHPALADEFAANGLAFAPNLAAARRLLW